MVLLPLKKRADLKRRQQHCHSRVCDGRLRSPDFLSSTASSNTRDIYITCHNYLWKNRAENLTLLSTNTKIPPAITNGTSSTPTRTMSSLQVRERAWSRQPCIFNGAAAELLTLLMAEKTDAPCTTFVSGRFAVDTLDGHPVFAIGHMRAYLINRSGNQWLEHHMSVPQGYKGDMRAHSGEGDSVSEMTKILRALYKENGDLKMDHTELEAEKVWYVEEFEIFSGWRGGQGYAQMAMKGFFKAACKMVNSSPNTFFLSPAPLSTAAADRGMPLHEMKNKDWQAIVDKLIAFYTTCGYQLWHKGRTDRRFTITLMSQEYTLPADDQEPSTALSQQALELINEWEIAPPPPPAVMAPASMDQNADAADDGATHDDQPFTEISESEFRDAVAAGGPKSKRNNAKRRTAD